MKKLFTALSLAALASTVLAAEPAREAAATPRELAAVSELGRINGIALACERPDLVIKARALMLARVPKTRQHGEAFEEATNQTFREQTTDLATCPEAVILSLRLEAADLRLMEAFPPMAPPAVAE